MKKFYTFLFLLVAFIRSEGQTPDWSTKIASIIYGNCTGYCHYEGGIAPFPLMTYDDALTYGFTIQEAVNAKLMPPWMPDPNYSHFKDEKVLSEDELAAINEWVDGGMPSGDLGQAPPPPIVNNGSLMLNISDTLILPIYTITTDTDDYRTFVIPSEYLQPYHLTEIEFVPGDPSLVHHLFFVYDTTDISLIKDLQDTLPGFAGDMLGSPGIHLICGWIPGSGMITLPAGMAYEIPEDVDYAVSIHYAPGSNGKTDSSYINLKYSPEPNPRIVTNHRTLYWTPPSLINPPFKIPADQVVTFYEQSIEWTVDKSIIAMQPHMHLIGKSFEVIMVDPNNDTTNLIYIPDWQFQWQMMYFVTKVIKMPAGSQIFGTGVYDNTVNNPENPNNPPITIYAGESTYDEMMACHFSILDYLPGDEDIILDSSFYGVPTSYEFSPENFPVKVFPNPASEMLSFSTWLPAPEIRWTITNAVGMVMKSSSYKKVYKGSYAEQVDVSDLPPGFYSLKLESGGEECVKKLMLLR